MRIETKFNFGDKVYHIWQFSEKVMVSCSFCAGIKTIVGANGEKASCPNCFGRGYATEYKKRQWNVKNCMTIGHVKFEITNSIGDSDSMFDNYKPQKKQTEQYMMDETGIGSGTLYYVENLFDNKNEAQKECDKRNKEGETNETD